MSFRLLSSSSRTLINVSWKVLFQSDGQNTITLTIGPTHCKLLQLKNKNSSFSECVTAFPCSLYLSCNSLQWVGLTVIIELFSVQLGWPWTSKLELNLAKLRPTPGFENFQIVIGTFHWEFSQNVFVFYNLTKPLIRVNESCN